MMKKKVVKKVAKKKTAKKAVKKAVTGGKAPKFGSPEWRAKYAKKSKKK